MTLDAILAAVAATPRDITQRQRAERLIEAIEDPFAAIDAYRRLVVIVPSASDAAFAAGLLATANGFETAGLSILQEAVRAQPGDARLWQLIGLAWRGLDEREAALAAFDRAASLNPADALIAHGHARCALEAGRPAVALFDRAHRAAPNDGDVLLGRAAAQHAAGRTAAALRDIEAMLRVHPGWLPGHDLSARLRHALGDDQNFAASLVAAAAATPRDPRLWLELVAVSMRAERFDTALDACASGLAAAGPHLGFAANEAICLSELGRADDALRAFAALPTIDEPAFAAWHLRHLLRSRQFADAAALGERLVQGPQAGLAWPYLGLAWRLLGDPRADWLDDMRLVGVFDLAEALPPLDELAEGLRRLHRSNAQPLDQSVRGGTQTDGPLFARLDPQIREVRALVVDAVRTYLDDLPLFDGAHPLLCRPRGDIRFAGSWSVRLAGAGHHAPHVHPAGWISSALYVTLPDTSEPAGWLTLGEPPASLGLDLRPLRRIEPKPGRLVLFPSTMWHGTVPFDEGERLSIAFDVAPPRQ